MVFVVLLLWKSLTKSKYELILVNRFNLSVACAGMRTTERTNEQDVVLICELIS